MKIFVFGSSLTSTYWNGAATYYRGLYRNLRQLGHEITFAEPRIFDRHRRQDAPNPDYARVLSYETPADIPDLLRSASQCDIVIKHSGVGAEDDLLEDQVLNCKSRCTRVVFWDVDAPATLGRVSGNHEDPFRSLIPEYDAIFTYGGGEPVICAYRKLGAKQCHAVYNALDPKTHHPVAPDSRLQCDLVFVGHRLPDRERRFDRFFLEAARLAPDLSFQLGGEGWANKTLPANVRWIGHISSGLHNQVNCSARMVLNINRESMAETGFSPPTRIFEAAGAGSCVITDQWEGLEEFFQPPNEILVASSPADVVTHLRRICANDARGIGQRMMQRALRDHTYESRARQVDILLHQLTRNTAIPDSHSANTVAFTGEPLS